MPGQTDERTARLITIVRQQSGGLIITLEYKDWPSSCGSLLNYKKCIEINKTYGLIAIKSKWNCKIK